MVKSIQRFGRNTVTVMSAINDIRHAGGYVYFEVENLDTKTAANDNIITIIGGTSQEESYFKSKSIKFGIRESLKNPDSRLYNRCCYGYWSYDGKMIWMQPIRNSKEAGGEGDSISVREESMEN